MGHGSGSVDLRMKFWCLQISQKANQILNRFEQPLLYFVCFVETLPDQPKYPRFLILSWEKEYLQTKQLLNATSHFLISHIVGHLLEFIKISLGPRILKIDNFT